MSFKLTRRETVHEGLRRIALEQLDGAFDDLHGVTQGAAIHRARKRLKMLRAILRLVRSRVTPAVFSRENVALRDVGRQMSVVRDADILLSVIRDLPPSQPSDATYRRVVANVTRHRQIVLKAFFADTARLKRLRHSIAEAKSRLDDWLAKDINEKTVVKGLRRSYKRGSQSFDRARRSRDDTQWHEWRKRTKDVWYHMRLIEPAWPAVFGAMVTECDDLADQLGEDHDLVVIEQRLPRVAPARDVGDEAKRLKHIIIERRRKLRDETRTTGRHLFHDNPRAFADRIEACLEVWRP